MVYSERPIYKHTTRDMDNPTVFELEKLSGSSQADPIRLGRVRSLDKYPSVPRYGYQILTDHQLCDVILEPFLGSSFLFTHYEYGSERNRCS